MLDPAVDGVLVARGDLALPVPASLAARALRAVAALKQGRAAGGDGNADLAAVCAV